MSRQCPGDDGDRGSAREVLSTAAAAVIGSLPGFTLPSVACRRWRARQPPARNALSIAVAMGILNAGMDALGYALFGPIGIVAVTVALRWIMAGVYV